MTKIEIATKLGEVIGWTERNAEANGRARISAADLVVLLESRFALSKRARIILNETRSKHRTALHREGDDKATLFLGRDTYVFRSVGLKGQWTWQNEDDVDVLPPPVDRYATLDDAVADCRRTYRANF